MADLFKFQVPLWEIVARGSLMYWFLFFLFRFVLRREAGTLGLADTLMIVLIADASQNGMAGGYESVGEGFALVGTIAGWNFLIDWMSFRYKWFARFAEPRVLPLIRHGKIMADNLRREMLTSNNLKSQLRESGIEDIREVKHARLEPDGHISIIKYGSTEMPRKKKHLAGAS